jgi:pyruvate/2-oxoglutarate dehydrogenase complex dihydrolipoamide acyltransferase (E2) component
MPNLELTPKRKLSNFRKVAIGTWRTAYDPSVYGAIELRMERALEYVEAYRAATGKRLTVTHMVGRAMGQALRQTPDANAILRFNRIYLRNRVSLLFQVAMTDEQGRADLSGATIQDVDEKNLGELVDDFEQKVNVIRKREDPQLERSRKLIQAIPYLLLNLFTRFVAFLMFTLNLDLRKLGMPKDPFGSAMITNIGSLGLDLAYVPLVPYARVPILLAMGAVRDEPVVEDGQLGVGKVMRITATFDHRFIDGVHAAAMARILRKWLEDPFAHYDAIPASAGESTEEGVEDCDAADRA